MNELRQRRGMRPQTAKPALQKQKQKENFTNAYSKQISKAIVEEEEIDIELYPQLGAWIMVGKSIQKAQDSHILSIDKVEERYGYQSSYQCK